VMDLLNDYMSALVAAIFKHDGTVDQITGDGILAVFGKPRAGPLRHEKAGARGIGDAVRNDRRQREAPAPWPTHLHDRDRSSLRRWYCTGSSDRMIEWS